MNAVAPRSHSRATMRPVTGAALALLALAAPAAAQTPAPAQGAPVVTLEEAIRMARENNPEFLAQENDIGTARWRVRSAYGNLLPSADASSSFGYSAAGVPRYGTVAFREQPASYSSSYSLGASMRIDGSTLLQPAVARAEARATESRVAGAGAQLVGQVTQQYLSVLQAEEEVDQARREVARTQEHVRLAQARLEVGAGTPLDVKRAEVQEGQARVRLLQAENGVAAARFRLTGLLGTPIGPETRLASTFQLFDPSWTAETLIEAAREHSPALRASRASVDAARLGVRSARTSYLPSVSMSVGVDGYVSRVGDIDPLVDEAVAGAEQNFAGCQRGNQLAELLGSPTQDCSAFQADPESIRQQIESRNSRYPFDYDRQPLGARLSVSLPIFTGFSRQLRVEQARASAEDARLSLRAEELRLTSDIATGVQNIETAYQTALLQEQVREAAAEELRLAQERFRFGAASSVEVTDAQASLAQAELAKINAVYNFHKSVAALEALIGQPLR